MHRRRLVQSAAGLLAGALPLGQSLAQSNATKLARPLASGTAKAPDFRDRLLRIFAVEVERRTKRALRFEAFAAASVAKTAAQFAALRKGTLDMALLPLASAGADLPELNIGLMPGLVLSYAQAYSWKNRLVGQEINRLLLDKGLVLVSWIWQAGGVVARSGPVVEPEDMKGLRVRSGSQEVDLVLKALGANVLTLPSSDIYPAMKSGSLDVAMASSTSLIAYQIEELAAALTTGRTGAYWFMLQPLLMSKLVFDALSADHREAILAVGADMEKFAIESAKSDDFELANVYRKAGAKVLDLSPATLKRWQDAARATAWKNYADTSEGCAKLLALAEQTLRV